MNPAALLTDPHAWAALLSLSVLEIVLGIDNLVFISLLTSGLDEPKARHARRIGLALAFLFRVVMLATLTWLVRLTQPFSFQYWDFLARYHSHRRRPLPYWKSHIRNPSRSRRSGG